MHRAHRTAATGLVLIALVAAGCSDGGSKSSGSATSSGNEAVSFSPSQAFAPTLTAELPDYQTTNRTTSLTLTVRQRPGEPVLDRVNFAIPPGYTLSTTSQGAHVGRIVAEVAPPPGESGRASTLSHELTYSTDTHSIRGCVSNPIGTLSSGDLHLDVYVDVESSTRLVVCLPPPSELPHGYPVRRLSLELDKLDETALGDVSWTAFFRPRIPGAPAKALARTNASQSIYVIPSVIQLNAKLDGHRVRSGRRLTFIGYLKVGAPTVDWPVTIWAGRSPQRLRPVGRAQTNSGGVFQYTLPVGGPGALVVQAHSAPRDMAKEYCQGSNPEAPAGCSAHLTELVSPLIRLQVVKR